MPNPQKLAILRQLREISRLTQSDVAEYFGFVGHSARVTIGRWENGDEIPPAKYRSGFISYLTEKLGLIKDTQTFNKVWTNIVDEWGWLPFTDNERQQYFGYQTESRDYFFDRRYETDENLYKSFTIRVIEALSINEFLLPPGVECLKTYNGKSGENYEIDLSYSFQIMGVNYLTLIESKSTWDKYVGRNSVTYMKGIIDDVGAHKGVLVSTVGFDSNAINLASKSGVALIKFSESKDMEIVSHLTGPSQSILKYLQEHARYNGGDIKRAEGIAITGKHIIDYIFERYGEEVAAFLAYKGSLSIKQIKPEYREKIIGQLKIMDKKRESRGMNLYEWLLDYDGIESCGLPVSVEPAMEIRLLNVKVATALWEISEMEKESQT